MRDKKLFYPAESGGRRQENRAEPAGKTKYPCPVCGCLTFPLPRRQAAAYICPVCFWENDVFTEDENRPSDENHGLSLKQARENYQKYSCADLRLARFCRKPAPEELPENKSIDEKAKIL